MPPKAAKEKPGGETPGDAALRTERCISLRVTGILSAKLDGPTLSVSIPGEDKPRVSAVLHECEHYEGDWAPLESTAPVLSLRRSGGTGEYEAHSKFGPAWRTLAALKQGETCKAEYLRVVDSRRSHWEPCSVVVDDTCSIVANGVRYARTGPHGFSFAADLMLRERKEVTRETAAAVFGAQLQVCVSHRVKAAAPPPPTEEKEGKGKAKGKGGAQAAPAGGGDQRETQVWATSPFSFAPLVMGGTRTEVVHAACGGGKARQQMKGFEVFAVEARCHDADGGVETPLLTQAMVEAYRPLCVSFLSLTDLPDSRPIAIHRTEDARERPFLDTLATQTPDYAQLRRHTEGVRLTCQLFPGADPIATPHFPHERSPGLYVHYLYFLSSIAQLTGGALPDLFQLVRHITTTQAVVAVNDRDSQGSVAGSNARGECLFTLRGLLVDGPKRSDEVGEVGAPPSAAAAATSKKVDGAAPATPNHATRRSVKVVLPVTQYRAPVEDAEGGADEDDDGVPATGKLRLNPGQYMSWGTTLTMRFSLAAPLPELSFYAAAAAVGSGRAAVAAALCAAAVAAEVLPEVAADEPAGEAAAAAAAAGDVEAAATIAEPQAASGAAASFTRDEFRAFLRRSETNTAATGNYHKVGCPPPLAPPPQPVRAPVPCFSRLIIKIKYNARSTRRVLHHVMRCVLQYTRASDEDDIVLFKPGDAAAADGEAPTGDAAGAGAGAAAAGGGDNVLQVRTPADKISGFEVIDGVWRIIVVEGMTDTVLDEVLAAFHGAVEDADLVAGNVSVVFNPRISFPVRSYIKWPPLVPFEPTRKKTDTGIDPEAIDAGGVGNRIRRMRLRLSIAEIAGTLSNYLKRRVVEGVLQAVRRLEEILKLDTLSQADSLQVFPTALNLVLLERMYGYILSPYDVCGSEDFALFTADIVDPSTAPTPALIGEEGGAGAGGTAAGEAEAAAVPKAQQKQTLEEYLQETRDHARTPTSIADLHRFVGKDVAVVGRPCGPALDGRVAPGQERGRCLLHVPLFGETLTLLLSDMPRPVKTVAIQVEGHVVELSPEEGGGVAVQAYRWSEHVAGGMGGESFNRAFLQSKAAQGRRLGYEHFHEIHREKGRRNREEQRKLALRRQNELDGVSSGSDCELDTGVRVVDTLPSVAPCYTYLNSRCCGDSSRRLRPGGETREVVIADEATSPGKTRVTKDTSAGPFSQLTGGWRPLAAEDCSCANLTVRVRTDRASQGKLARCADGGACTVVFKDGTSRTVPLSKLEVFSKNALLDNRHRLKPSPQRMVDLAEPWEAQKNPFERASDPARDLKSCVLGNPTGLFSGSFAAPSGVEEQPRRAAAAAGKQVVADPVFHVSHNADFHELDRLRGMLHDPPQRHSLRKAGSPTAPISIHPPSEAARKKNEVSTVYYPNVTRDRNRIKPLTDAERVGAVW